MQTKSWMAIAGLVTLGISITAAAAPQQRFEQAYRLESGGTFELRNVNGSVRIEAWDRPEVLVQAVKTARFDFSALERVQILAEERPGRVSVVTSYPENESNDVRVDFQIRVPRQVRLEHVETVNGDVYARGIEGSGELRTVNGNVTILDAGGAFSGRTTNGDLQLEFRMLPSEGRIVADTVNGMVVVSLPPDAGAELEVLSRNGDFYSELPITIFSGAGGREFRGIVGQAGPKLVLRTVNGGIRVVTPQPLV
jgi:hypothetical protein